MLEIQEFLNSQLLIQIGSKEERCQGRVYALEWYVLFFFCRKIHGFVIYQSALVVLELKNNNIHTDAITKFKKAKQKIFAKIIKQFRDCHIQGRQRSDYSGLVGT